MLNRSSVTHYKAVDSTAALGELNTLLAMGYVVIFGSTAELLLRTRRGMRLGFDSAHSTSILVLLADLLVLVLVPRARLPPAK